MELDLEKFYKACNPVLPLDASKPEDRAYYIELSAVRGTKLIEGLSRTIARISPDKPTCQLFTGHIGCGKSTELLRLKYELEQQNFHVVYFECDKQLELDDVDASDVLLAIAGQVSASLEAESIEIVPAYFKKLFGELKDLLHSPVDFSVNAKFSLGVAEVTAQSKASPSLRRQIRERLESRTSSIINAINQELLAPAQERLQKKGKKGLVAIVDNLDRIENRDKQGEQSRAGYLFVERGDQLRSLSCHLVYTIPLILAFSNEATMLENRFGTSIQTLPMVPIRLKDGSECAEGMALLRQVVMARAFPNATPIQRADEQYIQQVFDRPETLDRLCAASGGHVRNLLRLLFNCVKQEDPPFSAALVDRIVQQACYDLSRKVDGEEWTMLQQVQQDQWIEGEAKYRSLVKSLFVFQYEYQGQVWFDLDPTLAQAEKLKIKTNVT